MFREPNHVGFIEMTVFDAACVLHGNRSESQILVKNWDLLKLSLFINVEHDLGLHFHQRIDIFFKGLIWVIVAFFSKNVHMILLVQLPNYILLNSPIVVIEVLIAIVELQIIIPLFRHLFKLYFKWFIHASPDTIQIM